MLVFPPSSDVWTGKNRPQKRSNSCRTAANTRGKQIKEGGDKCFCRVFVTGPGVMVLMVLNGFKLRGGFRGDTRRVCSPSGWWNTSTGCLQRGWMTLLETSKVWMDRAGAAWLTWRCPCSLQGSGQEALEVPSNTNHAGILWFQEPCSIQIIYTMAARKKEIKSTRVLCWAHEI